MNSHQQTFILVPAAVSPPAAYSIHINETWHTANVLNSKDSVPFGISAPLKV